VSSAQIEEVLVVGGEPSQAKN